MKREKGFLLIEMLVSLTILAIAFSALAAVFSQSLLTAVKARHQLEAVSAMEMLLLRAERGDISGRENCGYGEVRTGCRVDKDFCEQDYCYYKSWFTADNSPILQMRFFMAERILN